MLSETEYHTPTQLFEAANVGRNYPIYTSALSAADEAKASVMFKGIDVPEGAVIVDVGSGTGKLAERAALQFSHARVFALDLSHELLEIANENRSMITLVYGNAEDDIFPRNSVDVFFCCTMGHEVLSFGGSLTKMLAAMYRALKPGGIVVFRDFEKPAYEGPVFMRILSANTGLPDPGEVPVEEIKYARLSKYALLSRFQREFRGGGAFQFETLEKDGKEYLKLPMEWAAEFYQRKDYTDNWTNEIKEKYLYWNSEEGRAAFLSAGFVNVEVFSELQEWIYEHRLKHQVELFVEDQCGTLVPLPIPATHMKLIGQKPYHEGVVASLELLPRADYDDLLSSIVVSSDRVDIDGQSFAIDSSFKRVGSKRIVYRLAGGEGLVLKVPNPSALNLHNAFKAMHQTIDRQQILYDAKVPTLEIVDYDKKGPPYRYLVQRALPEGAECAADLIREGRLSEEDVRQMAGIVNHFERSKKWQLDTNPFNWYRVYVSDVTTEMTYVDGKVYMYQEHWAFKRVGLLQWTQPLFVRDASATTASIPLASYAEDIARWWNPSVPPALWWNKYLHEDVKPWSLQER